MEATMDPGAPQGAPAAEGGPVKVIQEVHSGLLKLAKAMSGVEGAPPEVADRLAAMAEEFQELISSVSEPQEPKPVGNSPMEAGANPNARPV